MDEPTKEDVMRQAVRAVAAADYALARIGSDNAQLLAASLSAGWLTDDEYEILRPLAVAVSWIAGLDTPQHRGRS